MNDTLAPEFIMSSELVFAASSQIREPDVGQLPRSDLVERRKIPETNPKEDVNLDDK